MTQDERWIRQKTINHEMCSKCEGRCCKQCGCSYFPSDLKMTFNNLMSMINNRNVSIDRMDYKGSIYIKVEPQIYYLRVAIEGEPKISINNQGKCHLLKENGCSLSYDERPTGGKLIVPFWSGCYPLYSYEEFITSWKPYQELIKKIILEIEKDC